MMFERVFATGTRTVRGLEALSLGTPPIPGQSIVRRPNNEHLATLGELLEHQGFATYFFYGGYGYFDNMSAYFSANDYRVIDRTDFPKETVMFENVWGVADEALFDNVIRTFDTKPNTGKPFFAHIMTTTNHRPYTYPNGRIDIPAGATARSNTPTTPSANSFATRRTSRGSRTHCSSSSPITAPRYPAKPSCQSITTTSL
jgi:phosphoglycerol transferase MdoB-like AlkP superfamily enzyme